MTNIIPIRRPSIARLECSGCGATTDARCNCGLPYVPAGTRAAEAVAANPEKSDRLIATELKVSPTTVGKARKATVHSGQLAKRVGKDGKARKLPTKKPALTGEQIDTLLRAMPVQDVVAIARHKGTPREGLTAFAEASERVARRARDQSACDYDWSNPSPKDFGNPSKMYRKQAEHYRDEAIHFAKAYPLLAKGVDSKVITETEINAAQQVVDAWVSVVSKLRSRRITP